MTSQTAFMGSLEEFIGKHRHRQVTERLDSVYGDLRERRTPRNHASLEGLRELTAEGSWWDLVRGSRRPFGSEPGFRRPVLVVQADSFNRSRIGTVLCVPFTTNLKLADAPGNVHLDTAESGLRKESVIVVSQVTCLDRIRLVEKAGSIEPESLREVEAGIRLVLAL